MKYGDLNRLLIQRVPELSGGYWELRKLHEGSEPGPHVVYGDLLTPLIRNMILGGAAKSQLAVLFAFLEELAISTPDVREVLGASVLERLVLDTETREMSLRQMGPKTAELARRIIDAWL